MQETDLATGEGNERDRSEVMLALKVDNAAVLVPFLDVLTKCPDKRH